MVWLSTPSILFLGASPDASIKCCCCDGKGIVEIKCPFSSKDRHPSEIHELKNSFLNKIGLHQNHKYFTQVQGQLAICRKEYCDFVAWTPQGILIERIKDNTNFTESLIRKLTKFYVEHMLPEAFMHNRLDASRLPARSDSDVTNSDEEMKYCLCQGEHGKMICSDNPECEILWFHFKCVGIKHAPKGEWFCPNCTTT